MEYQSVSMKQLTKQIQCSNVTDFEEYLMKLFELQILYSA